MMCLRADVAVGSVQPGYEDRVMEPTKPKRKWKRKIYPDSAVRRSARIRTAKNSMMNYERNLLE